MFDLDAYLSRIGLSGRPSLADVHVAHATTIPFEGFDSHMGIAPRLDAEALVEKLVRRRRGGYCYEQNLLLKAALQALGYQVDPYLARVMIGLAPGASLLRVLDRALRIVRVTDRSGRLLRVRNGGEDGCAKRQRRVAREPRERLGNNHRRGGRVRRPVLL